MKCRLCLKDNKLLKRSHIISNFLFTDVFDDKHRMVKFEMNNQSLNDQIVQSSLWESDLLCSDCDNEILSKIETYAMKYFILPVKDYSKNLPPPSQMKTELFKVNYQSIKLFLLSLLWRVSISKNPAYKYINLGKHEDIIREMLNNNNPGALNEYPFLIYSLINSNNYNSPNSQIRMCFGPFLQKWSNGYDYVMQIPGFIFIMRISNHGNNEYLNVTYKDEKLVLVSFPPEIFSKSLVNKLLRAKIF